MSNLFLDLVFDPKCRMNEVIRYSGVYQENPENLAEHTADVLMLSYLVAQKLISFGESIDIGLLLEKCLLHDVEEVITGDMPRTTKYATVGIKREMGHLGKKSAEYLLDERQYDLWANSKLGKEGLIVRFSDFLAVAKKSLLEVDLRGNYSFLKVLVNSIKMAESFPVAEDIFDCEESRLYLFDIIGGVLRQLNFVYEKHKEKANDYRLIDECF